MRTSSALRHLAFCVRRQLTYMPSPSGVTSAAATPLATPGSAAVLADGDINWHQVDRAMDYFHSFDVMELADQVVAGAVTKGPKNVYNEAGTVRYRMAKAKSMYADMASTICTESLETKREKIAALERIVAAKGWIDEIGQ